MPDWLGWMRSRWRSTLSRDERNFVRSCRNGWRARGWSILRRYARSSAVLLTRRGTRLRLFKESLMNMVDLSLRHFDKFKAPQVHRQRRQVRGPKKQVHRQRRQVRGPKKQVLRQRWQVLGPKKQVLRQKRQVLGLKKQVLRQKRQVLGLKKQVH